MRTFAERYGRYYWCVKVTKDVSKDGEIYVFADKTRVRNGCLEFIDGKDNTVNLAIAPGKWLAYFGASVFDGSAVAVEYWVGEIVSPNETKGDDSGDKGRHASQERSKVTKSLRYDVLKRDNFKCQACGANGGEANLVIDHIVPIAQGGKTELSNLQTLCHDCNAGKRDKV